MKQIMISGNLLYPYQKDYIITARMIIIDSTYISNQLSREEIIYKNHNIFV